jgi:SAM-dependent methyltransferase
VVTIEERRARTLQELRPYIERARSFSGWSFDDLRVKHLDPPMPWDYEKIAREYATTSSRVLDLGTGGGEVLSRIASGVRARFVASEEWHVNVPVARDRLAPLGIEVLHADSTRPPLRDASFDLVLDRHEALDPAATALLLRHGGTVITQQCAPDDWREIQRFFPHRTDFGDHYRTYAEGFASAGLTIERRERHERRSAYPDLGDVVYMLLVAPWWLPSFDPEQDIDTLLALEDGLRTEDGIVLTDVRYLLIARKPMRSRLAE